MTKEPRTTETAYQDGYTVGQARAERAHTADNAISVGYLQRDRAALLRRIHRVRSGESAADLPRLYYRLGARDGELSRRLPVAPALRHP